MDVTIALPAELSPKLESAARRQGRDITSYIQALVMKEVTTPALAEILTPARAQFTANGKVEENPGPLFESERQVVRNGLPTQPSAAIIPHKNGLGWIMDIPADMTDVMKIAPGSFLVLYAKEGTLETEILPPPSDELLADFERIFEEYRETFEELERLGD